MILADTSIWVDHLRAGDRRLADALERGDVCVHPLVIGELACGNLRQRRRILDLLAQLPVTPIATDPEVLSFIERRALMGRGLGYLDVHLLAAVAIDGETRLWTRDKRLAAAATSLHLALD